VQNMVSDIFNNILDIALVAGGSVGSIAAIINWRFFTGKET